jgi:hypothetical protein
MEKNQNKLFNHFFIIVSHRSNAEKKIGKLDPIYRNQLINMLVNQTWEEIISLSNSL